MFNEFVIASVCWFCAQARAIGSEMAKMRNRVLVAWKVGSTVSVVHENAASDLRACVEIMVVAAAVVECSVI